MNCSPILGWLELTNYRSPAREQGPISAALESLCKDKAVPSTQPFLDAHDLLSVFRLDLCVLWRDSFTTFYIRDSPQSSVLAPLSLGWSCCENLLMISVGSSLTSPAVRGCWKPSTKLHAHHANSKLQHDICIMSVLFTLVCLLSRLFSFYCVFFSL